MKIGAILLAAGRSRRFGADKLIQSVPGDDRCLGERAAMVLTRAAGEVVAIVPSGQQRLSKRLEALGVRCLVCDQSARGMGHSLAYGVAATAEWDGWIVMLADMPLIQSASVAAVAQAVRDGAVIAAPYYRGRRGHPVGFNRQCFPELVALQGDVGARAILAARQQDIVPVPCDDPAIVLDVDTPADLAALGWGKPLC